MAYIRSSYSSIKKKYKDIGKDTVRLTQSSLILEREIDPATDTYTFPIKDTDDGDSANGKAFIEEIRLDQNDEFIAYQLGYYLVADKLASGTYAEEEILGRAFLPYAPDELSSVFSVYEDAFLGTLFIMVNKINRLDRWDLKRHNFIPRTQFQNTSVGVPQATQPSIDYSKDGMFNMQPMLTLSGAKKNDITVELIHAIPLGVNAAWAPAAGAGIFFHMRRLALVFRGMLAQNASSFQK